MSSIDSRVVEMKFNNAQFEAGIQKTLSSLESLKKGLKLEGASKGLTDVSAVANKGLSLSKISSGVSDISSKFSAMSIVGIAALSTIASKAASVGLQVAKSLSLKPMQDGFADYELKIGATQTIMAGTGEGIGTVTKYLKDLDIYADKTIYSLSDMVGNISKFTNAGVKLPVAVDAMKGIANVAALSGASSEEAARAMYNLGQAIGQGTVKLIDWKSVELANMGTMEFKQQLMDSAVSMGTLKKATDGSLKTTKGHIVTSKNFSTTLADGWLTADALTKTLGNYANEQTAIGKKAYAAAKDVKTFSMMVETLKAAAGTGWTDTFDLTLGTLPQATEMFTNLTNVIGGFIGRSADARNKVLGDWNKLGGRSVAIDAISNAFNALMSVLKPIGEAFRLIFPATTGQQLYDLTEAVRHFTEKLKMGEGTIFKIKLTFAGFFAVLSIGKQILMGAVGMFLRIFGAASKGSGGILDFTAKIGNWLVNLDQAIKRGDGLTEFFRKLGDPIVVVISLLQELGQFIGRVFSGLGTVDLSGLDALQARFAPLGRIGDVIAQIWSRVGSFFQGAWQAFEPIANAFSTFFENVGKTVQDSMGNVNYAGILDTINTGLFAGLAIMIKKFMKGGGAFGIDLKADVGGGMFSSIKSSFGELTQTLKVMQMSLKAEILLKIAAALALLTISVVALSMIDSAGLTRALTAMTIMFTQLMVSMKVLENGATLKGSANVGILSTAMILLAVAVDLLAIAVSKLAKLDWKGLAKGLVGVTVLLGALVVVSKTMSKDAAGMIKGGAGLILMAVAINLLATAVTSLSGLSWEEMGKGLVGVGALLGSLVLFTKFAQAGKTGMLQGAGIILLAVGIKILASALKDFATMSWEEIGRGLVAMGGGLVIMAAALALIPPSSIFSAAAVLIVASALGMIGDALKSMGAMQWDTIGKGMTSLAGALTLIAAALLLVPPSSLLSAAAIFVVAASLGMIATALGAMGGMSWEEIAKGLVTLAGALGIIAIAMAAMSGALIGAAALLVVSASLAILAPILVTFGNMSWEEIGKGLLVLAGAFVVLGVAGLVLTPIVPTLLGLGVAITLMGIGMLAAGAGLLLFSVGLTALSVAGAAGSVAIVGIVSALIGLIPMLMTEIGLGVVAFANVIAMSAPAIMGAITAVLMALIGAINTVTPKIVTTLLRLIFLMVGALVAAVPRLVNAGFQLLLGILNGISRNIGKVVTAAASIIVNFINGISSNLGRIIESGVQLILSFIRGITGAINAHSAELGAAGGELATALVRGMASGIGAGLGVVKDAAVSMAKTAFEAAKSFLHINSPSKKFAELGMGIDEGLGLGIDKFSHIVTTATEGVGHEAINSLRTSISGLSDIVSGEVNINPVITPVLDLTSVKKDASAIGSLLGVGKISLESSYAKAKDASSSYASNQLSEIVPTTVPTASTVSFTQNNNSPKALSAAEIYRQTKNQLSIVKGALT